MISVVEAKQRLLEEFDRLDLETISLNQSVGRVLAQSIVAKMDLPPFSNSGMDGFAVRSVDVIHASNEKPILLKVIGDIPAGSAPDFSISIDSAGRIMTGAVLPAGADCVVPVEDTDFNFRGGDIALPELVKIFTPAQAGQNVRIKGQDVQVGDQVLEEGRWLRPQEVGFLSMLGFADVPVYRKPRVGVLSSGNELLQPGEAIEPGKIFDANSVMLSGQIERAGGEVVSLGISSDQADDLKRRLDNAVRSGIDLIVSSAGVSVGAFDLVRGVIEEEGDLAFWKVNMRPGKPFVFGHYQQIPFFGLPGNPVSAFVSFEVFVRPALSKMTGRGLERQRIQVTLGEALESDGRESYLRAIISDDGNRIAHLTGHQGSGNLRSLVQANALLIVPSGVKSLPTGSMVEAWSL